MSTQSKEYQDREADIIDRTYSVVRRIEALTGHLWHNGPYSDHEHKFWEYKETHNLTGMIRIYNRMQGVLEREVDRRGVI